MSNLGLPPTKAPMISDRPEVGEGVSIRVIRTVEEIESIRDVWMSSEGHRDSDIDVYLALLRSNPDILRPHVIVLYREGRPETLLIGRLASQKIDIKIGYFHLSRPKLRVLDFVYRGLRGKESTEYSKILIAEILHSLRQGEADTALLEHVRVDTSLYECATRSAGPLMRDYLFVTYPHHKLELPQCVNQSHAVFSGDDRRKQKRRAKKLEEAFPNGVRIACYRQPEELDRLIQDAEQIAQTSYQRGLGVGFEDNEPTRNLLLLEANRGWLFGYVMYISGEPSAFWIGILYQGTFISEFLSYNPRDGKYGPGTFLVMSVIEGLCKENRDGVVREIDFGLGDSEWKRILSSCEWDERPVYIFAPTLKGLAINAARTIAGFLDHFAKRILERSALLPRVKKLWRDYVTKPGLQPEEAIPRNW